MITCENCGDTTGPWVRLPIGFVCENCLEKEQEKLDRIQKNYLKGNDKK